MAANSNLRRWDAGGCARPAGEASSRHVEQTCRTAVEGRRAARILADWVQHFGLSEPEFQVLWCLRSAAGSGVDQTTLAKGLAFSTAQVSAIVERVRGRGWIAQQAIQGDRRRHSWQLAASGHEVLETMLSSAASLYGIPSVAGGREQSASQLGEAAA